MNVISQIVQQQKKYFNEGNTKNIEKRKQLLKKLKSEIKVREEDVLKALQMDLGKSSFEAYATEVGIVYDEINIMIKNLSKWSKRERVKSSIVHFPSKNYIYKEPYGVTLIIGPFNYPFQLTLAPLIGAIAAGNCAVIKPSEYSMNTSNIIEEIIQKVFKEELVKVVEPSRGKALVEELLEEEFDYIFFTGSIRVGKIIMEKAAKRLIPVTLELGGKSPCIVDKNANIKLAAKRFVWGKFINAGQTCVAPDYLFVQDEIKEELLKYIVKEIKLQYGEEIENNKEYPRIINEREVYRLVKYLEDGEIFFGGDYSIKDRYFHPTILTNIKNKAAVMEEEIFGPIVPVITFKNIDEVIKEVNGREKPLALYYFSENNQSIEYILSSTTSGGVTINDTVIHVATSSLPFGGVGTSGIGAYHGKASFDTFTHRKSVLKRGTFMELQVRYAPFGNKIKLLRKVMK